MAWILRNGPIPDGTQVDHQCHNLDTACDGGPACPHRGCVNPDHLRLATPALNKSAGRSRNAVNARKTHCKYGHRDWEVRPNGHRRCVTCHRRESREQAERARRRKE